MEIERTLIPASQSSLQICMRSLTSPSPTDMTYTSVSLPREATPDARAFSIRLKTSDGRV